MTPEAAHAFVQRWQLDMTSALASVLARQANASAMAEPTELLRLERRRLRHAK